jgi:MFS family permease
VSIFGDRLHQFSVVGMIGRVAPGSSAELLQFALFGHLPVLLFAPFFGSLIDRANRTVVMIVVDIIRAGLVMSIPTLFHLLGNMYAFYIPICLLSLANLLFAPAKSAAIPEYFGALKLLRINAVLWGLGIIGTIGGFLLGGWLFDFRSWKLGFYYDALSYVISGLFLLPLFLLPQARRRTATPETGVREPGRSFGLTGLLRSVREGLVLVRTDRRIAYCIIAQASLFGVLGMLYVIGIARVQEVLPADKTIYLSAVAIAGTIGLLAGSAFSAAARKWMSFNRVVAHSTVLLAISLLGVSRVDSLIPLMAWAFILGFSVSPITVVTETLLQTSIPESFRGRVFSTREVGTKTTFLGMSLISTLSDVALDKATILLTIGVLLAVVGVWIERKNYLSV